MAGMERKEEGVVKEIADLRKAGWQLVFAAVIAGASFFALVDIIPPFWVLLQHVRAILWGVVLLVTGSLQGWVLLRPLLPGTGSRDLDSAFFLVVVAGLGLGFLSLELFFLGLVGLFTRLAITAFVLCILAVCAGVMWLRKMKLPQVDLGWEAQASLPLGFTALAVFLNLYLALVPPVFFDALSYHLELPSRYLQAGRIFHIPENLYSGYPQLVEVLYGAGLALGGVDVAGILSLVGFLLVLTLIWTWARAVFGDESAAWATAIISFTPPLMLLVGFYHNDWYLAFYTLAAVMLLSRVGLTTGTMALVGCAAGLAAGTKYTALAFALAIPLFAGLVMDLVSRRKGRAVGWVLFLAAAVLVASPWYLKNFFFTGDPLFPLFSGLKGGVEGLSDLARDTHFRGLGLNDLWGWVLVPWQAVFQPSRIQLALSMGVLPLALAPTLFSLRKKHLVSPFLLAWIFGSLAVWYLTFRAGRFALPMILIFLVWISGGFRMVVRAEPAKGRFLTGMVVFLLFINLGHVVGFVSVYADVLKGALTRVSADTYLTHTYAPYRAISFLNNTHPQPKVLFLGEMRGFYSRFPREVPTFEVPNRLLAMIRSGKTAEEMAESLITKGFSHILYNRLEMERLGAKTTLLRLDESEKERLDDFFQKKTIGVFSDSGISVREIRRE